MQVGDQRHLGIISSGEPETGSHLSSCISDLHEADAAWDRGKALRVPMEIIGMQDIIGDQIVEVVDTAWDTGTRRVIRVLDVNQWAGAGFRAKLNE